MNNIKIAKQLVKIARVLVSDSDYIYDPDHKKHPGGGYHETESGWSKRKEKSRSNEKLKNEKHNETLEIPYGKAFDLAKGYYTNEEDLSKLSKHSNSNIRNQVAQNTHTPKKALNDLSYDNSFFIRESVARNPNTSSETLDNLVSDENEDVRNAVSSNPNASEKALDILSHSNHLWTRMQVSKHKNTSIQTLERMSEDSDSQIVEGVAQNRNSHPGLIEKIFEGEHGNKYGVQRAISENHNTPQEILDRLSTSSFTDVRMGVASNPSSSMETLKNLAHDNNANVSKSARKTIKQLKQS